MTTYEEDIVDIYYNLQDFFTMKNIPFPAIEKRAGGKGRGEIDVLAIKIKDEEVRDVVHVEVGVSLTSKFPFSSPLRPNSDESYKLLKKFLLNDSGHMIEKLIGETKFRRVFVSSDFDEKFSEKLRQNIPKFKGEVIGINQENERVFLKLKYEEKVADIEIIPFSVILEGVKNLFKIKGLEKKNFQDPRYRAIHYLITQGK